LRAARQDQTLDLRLAGGVIDVAYLHVATKFHHRIHVVRARQGTKVPDHGQRVAAHPHRRTAYVIPRHLQRGDGEPQLLGQKQHLGVEGETVDHSQQAQESGRSLLETLAAALGVAKSGAAVVAREAAEYLAGPSAKW
jgi:hypothetical protein